MSPETAAPQSTPEVPLDLGDVDASWLTAALSPALGRLRVGAVEVVPITDGVGLVGQVGRIVPTYDQAPDDAPGELILKMPTADPAIRGFAAGMGMYEREGRFYAEVAPLVTDVSLPRVLFNVCDPAHDQYCILMEKLEIARTISQHDGVTIDHAAEIIGTIARLHATWFDHPKLDEWAWLPRPSHPVNKSLTPRFARAWPHFLEHHAQHVPAEAVGWVEEFAGKMDDWWDGKDHAPYTLVHGDFRLDNMVWTPGDDLVLLDWQIVQAGFGLYDIAYFIITNLSVDDRRKAEDQLLDQWRTTLLDSGANPGSAEEVHRLYRETVLFWTTGVTCATAEFGATPEGRALVDMLLERSFTAAADLCVGEVMPG
ncbi:MAG TPA: phosphotransferase [Acidimicrobiales bacterium]